MSTPTSSSTPQTLIEHLERRGRRRAAFVLDRETRRLRAYPAELGPLADELSASTRDFDSHEAIFLQVGERTRTLQGAFLHRTLRGQGAGGVRHWSYDTLGDMFSDGLRLAQGMGRKNALAGLWWGGGKGVIVRGASYREPDFRRQLYAEYGALISSLRGCYVTAEDVGTNAEDMAAVFSTTRHVTCVPAAVGGSGNPSGATARGVVCAMDAGLEFLDRGNLRGRTVVLQGAGNVGAPMVGELLQREVTRVVASDIDGAALERARASHDDERVQWRQVAADDTSIFGEPCDVFAPNALGGVLNPDTIPMLKTKVVCGAANNQLLDDTRDDALLEARGIVYVPDFVANRMGIVQCANEQYGWIADDPAIERHFDASWNHGISVITQRVLSRSQKEGVTSTRAANALADELMHHPHPLWPHRGWDLIQSLVRDEWWVG